MSYRFHNKTPYLHASQTPPTQLIPSFFVSLSLSLFLFHRSLSQGDEAALPYKKNNVRLNEERCFLIEDGLCDWRLGSFDESRPLLVEHRPLVIKDRALSISPPCMENLAAEGGHMPPRRAMVRPSFWWKGDKGRRESASVCVWKYFCTCFCVHECMWIFMLACMYVCMYVCIHIGFLSVHVFFSFVFWLVWCVHNIHINLIVFVIYRFACVCAFFFLVVECIYTYTHRHRHAHTMEGLPAMAKAIELARCMAPTLSLTIYFWVFSWACAQVIVCVLACPKCEQVRWKER